MSDFIKKRARALLFGRPDLSEKCLSETDELLWTGDISRVRGKEVFVELIRKLHGELVCEVHRGRLLEDRIRQLETEVERAHTRISKTKSSVVNRYDELLNRIKILEEQVNEK